MILLAYCAGLRRGELARLDLGDVDLRSGTITVRETKFYKTRILPLTDSVMVELRTYPDARRRTGAPQEPQSGLFWQDHFKDRYTPVVVSTMITNVMRLAGFKPPSGRIGPRVHDLRHSMVVNRILEWYRAGINPQGRLHFLSTYMGHRDINSTLVYITVTQDLLQEASAVHLVAAGVYITVIRSWLGHVSLDTTNHYAQAADFRNTGQRFR